MQFVQGSSRYQTYFATLEDQVAADNPARLMDAFIEKLELEKLGFSNTVHKSEGRPGGMDCKRLNGIIGMRKTPE